jgi:uncharacterized membrane protein YfcA
MSSHTSNEPLVGIELGALRKIRPRELVIRFAFGAFASLLAGCITLVFGARAGGLFLAFPAILTASLTMIEKKDGTSAAVHDIEGAVLGAAGLAAFAIVVEQTLEWTSLGWALALAFGAWLATALALYFAAELTRRGIQRRRKGSPR